MAAVAAHLYRRRHKERAARKAQAQARAQGLTEPPSLHPVVDDSRCIGSGACVHACPEGALGIVGGKARLIHPTACIGHGACHAACPVEAIQLVFGTARRGVDIPQVSPRFESNVPGLFIAGELGGMGLIRKAAEQGKQAVQSIRHRKGRPDELDLVIVGAGPAGISATLAAHEAGLRYRTIEQEPSLGGTVFHYPRNKVAMTAPVKLALVGSVRINEVSKERLLAIWQDIVQRSGVRLHLGERMDHIERQGEGFVVHTDTGSHPTRSVLLAIGRRGSPRRLDVPGEDQPKVVYRLTDAEQYQGQAVLVVGGGDSALEAALALAQQTGTTVQLSYRGQAFNRVKTPNRLAVEQAARDGQIEVLMGTQVLCIEPASVSLAQADQVRVLPNDAVIVCAGGVLPTDMLRQMGIAFDTKYGEA
jgi:thioredoxin reductase/NAD-dependent dihydropyrimidine dehydrogenase PreA subunit